MMRAASIQQNVKTTEIFGGLDIFATLSQVLTYNSFPLYIYISPARACKFTAFLAIKRGGRIVF